MNKKQQSVDVVCFYWPGTDRPGWSNEERAMQYINTFFGMMKRNTNIPIDVHCITTLEPFSPFIKFHKLESPSWKGCLPKYSVFNKDLGFKGRVFACDLDVVVVGDMDEILSYDGPLATRSTFVGKKESGGDMVAFDAGSGKYNWIWDEFVTDPEGVENFTGGRERWIYRYHPKLKDKTVYLQDVFPGQIHSYKRHVRGKNKLPGNARIVSCHGNPRPHEIKENWVLRNWK